MRNLAMRFAVICSILFVFFGIPFIRYADRIAALRDGGADAVSGATLALPAKPSGTYFVILNAMKHSDTIEEWTDFFLEEPTDVIFEDLDCMVIDTDETGIRAAERCQARLAENQMRLRREDGLLAVSKVQWGVFDLLILSVEAAEVCRMDTVYGNESVLVITVERDGL